MNQEARKNATQARNKDGAKSSSAVREAALKASITAIDGPSTPSKQAKISEYEEKAQKTAFTTSAVWGDVSHIEQAQNNAFEQGRAAVEAFFNTAASALGNSGEWAEISRIQSDAAQESADIAAEVAQSIGNEISEFSNTILSEQFKAFEKFLSCKTASDFFQLQSDFLKNSLDQGINRFSNIAQYCVDFAKAAEPINRSISEASEKVADAFTADLKK